MQDKPFPFLEGIALAFEQATPVVSTAKLSDEVNELSTRCMKFGFYPDIQSVLLVNQREIAKDWFGSRVPSQEATSGDESYPAIVRAIQRHARAQGHSRHADLGKIKGAAHRVADDKLIELLTGVQVGLSFMRPDITEDILAWDWSLIFQAYPRAKTRYLKNNVPAEAVPILFAKELVNFRLRQPRGWLASLRFGLGFGERYGWLAVKTEPSPAKVSVDEDDWGESPAENGVRAGSHLIKAEKDRLLAELQVEVRAACSTPVHLKLQ